MDKWYRVNRKHPCRICSKVDWCTYQADADCCMRVESSTPMKNGGWLHKSDGPIPYVPPPRKAIQERPPNLAALWSLWSSQTDFHQIDGLAMSLGVDAEALGLIGCARADSAWAFQMKNAAGEMIGIRLRDDSGNKWAVRGSKQGLFLSEFGCEPVAYVVEGPTDAAAALTIELSVIGRPSCLGCEGEILAYVQRQKIRRVIIIADNDTPGLRGAAKLQSMLHVPSIIVTLPCKDLREFVGYGGTAKDIESIARDTVWSNPRHYDIGRNTERTPARA